MPRRGHRGAGEESAGPAHRHPTALIQVTRAARVLGWVTGLTLLATVVAVIALTVTGQTSYLTPVIGIGAAEAAVGGTIHVRIHIRR